MDINPIHVVVEEEEEEEETREESNKTTTVVAETQDPEASSLESKKISKEGAGQHDEDDEEGGREKLKRHRVEVAGRVWIPDMWGQEELLKDWIDCTAFDAALVRTNILMARDSLAEERRTTPPIHPLL